jgi:hypothetical protein
VVTHCGDLTEESKISEIKASIELPKSIKAPLKLVIAGSRAFTDIDNERSEVLETLASFKAQQVGHAPR